MPKSTSSIEKHIRNGKKQDGSFQHDSSCSSQNDLTPEKSPTKYKNKKSHQSTSHSHIPEELTLDFDDHIESLDQLEVDPLDIENEMERIKISGLASPKKSPTVNDASRRRSTRVRQPSSKYLSNYVSPKKSQRNAFDDDGALVESEEWSDIEMEPAIKPTTLLDDSNSNIESKLYSFKTPKKRDAMFMAAANTPKTPKSGATDFRKTPKRTSKLHHELLKTPKSGTARTLKLEQKTPHHVRRKIKEEIQRKVYNESNSDFSGSDDSEYNPDGSSSSDDGSEDDTAEDVKFVKSKRKILLTVPKTPITAGRLTRSRLHGKQEDFVLESDGYFAHHTNKKMLTSNNTLDHLKTPRLPHEQLFKLLGSMRLSAVHEKAIAEMNTENEENFDKWLFQLGEGYSIILYGLGSKRTLLETFRTERLTEQNVIVVNGFFPSLTIKSILDGISNDILELNVNERNPHEVVDEIERELRLMTEMHIFLIVHNIDGVMLRTQKDQTCLSRLARIPNIHLLTSIDHINTPFLWDYTKLNNFKFSWWNCTTMLPYTEETSFENSMLVQNTGSLALASMKNVFASLTQNSRKIFITILKYELAASKGPHYQGMPYKELYHQCRQSFAVSSDMALRAQLTEFLDHHMVKIKRTADGGENLLIPMERDLLQQLLNSQPDADDL